MYRNIFEKSVMSNNDMLVYYTKQEVDFHPKDFRGRLVVSRWVYDIEIEKGLEIGNPRRLERDETLTLTLLLDRFYIVRNSIQSKSRLIGRSLDKAVADYVAYGFYDCMSAGMPPEDIAIIKELIRCHPEIDLNTEVYRSPSLA